MSRKIFLTICVIIFQHTGRIFIRCYALYIYIYASTHTCAGAVRWKMSVCATLEMCVVDGLEPNTPYRFRVSAANLHGRGAFSWPSCERCTLDEGVLNAVEITVSTANMLTVLCVAVTWLHLLCLLPVFCLICDYIYYVTSALSCHVCLMFVL